MKRKRGQFDARFEARATKEIHQIVSRGHNMNKSTLHVLQKFTSLHNIDFVKEPSDLFREFKLYHYKRRSPEFFVQRLLFDVCQADFSLAENLLAHLDSKAVSGLANHTRMLHLTIDEFHKWPCVEMWIRLLEPERQGIAQKVVDTLCTRLWNQAFTQDCPEFESHRAREIQTHLFYVSAMATLDTFPELFTIRGWRQHSTLKSDDWAILPGPKRWILRVRGETMWTLVPRNVSRMGREYIAITVLERNGPSISYGALQSHPWSTFIKLWHNIQQLLIKIFPSPLVPICISYMHGLGDHSLIHHYN